MTADTDTCLFRLEILPLFSANFRTLEHSEKGKICIAMQCMHTVVSHRKLGKNRAQCIFQISLLTTVQYCMYVYLEKKCGKSGSTCTITCWEHGGHLHNETFHFESERTKNRESGVHRPLATGQERPP